MNRWPGYWQGPSPAPFTMNRGSSQSRELAAWLPAVQAPGRATMRVYVTDRIVTTPASPVVDPIAGRMYSFVANGPVTITPMTWSLLSSSITLWINLDSASRRGSWASYDNAGYGWAVGVGNTSFDDLGNNLIVESRAYTWVNPGIAIGTGLHFVAVTASGVSAVSPTTMTYRFFLDGRFRAQANATCRQQDMYGRLAETGNNRAPTVWIGDARFYRKALTPGEIWHLYAPQTRWELYESLLLAWDRLPGGWAFNPVWDGRGVIGSNVVTGV